MISIMLMALQLGLATHSTPNASTNDCYLTDGTPYSCHTFDVPLDHKKPDGKQIALFYGIFENETRGKPRAPVFVLAGGPGQSAIDAFTPINGRFKQVFGNRNVYVIDQRGLGKSTPLSCKALDDLDYDDFPVANETVVSMVKHCAKTSALPLNHFKTDDFIDDLEQLRKALGLPKVILYGASYGTRVATRYAMRFPDAVEKLVLEGFAGLDLVLYKNFRQDMGNALKQIQKRCLAEPDCDQHFPDIVGDFEYLLTRLPRNISLKNPVSLKSVDMELTTEMLINWVNTFLYSPQTQNLLPIALKKARQEEDFSILAGPLANPSMDISTLLHFAVACYEDEPALGDATLMDAETKALTKSMRAICRAFPADTIAKDFRTYKNTNIPTLFISGATDPVTPPHYVDKIKTYFPNSHHLRLASYSHTYSFRLKCARQSIHDFLDGSYTAHCANDLPVLSIFRTPMGY